MATYDSGVVLVLGGSGHIGSAIVRVLAQQGVQVAFTYRRRNGRVDELADERQDGVRATAHQVDVLEGAALGDLLQTLASRQRVHTVIHAAGTRVPQRYFSQIPPDEWLHAVNFELTGFFGAARCAVEALRKGGGGSLIALTSSAIHRYAARDSLSAVPKAAVEMLVRAIAKEEGRHGIRANCIAPGLIDGGVGRSIIEELGATRLLPNVTSATPLGRLVTAQEIAHAAAFLASREASAITGQTIVVDGGLSL